MNEHRVRVRRAALLGLVGAYLVVVAVSAAIGMGLPAGPVVATGILVAVVLVPSLWLASNFARSLEQRQGASASRVGPRNPTRSARPEPPWDRAVLAVSSVVFVVGSSAVLGLLIGRGSTVGIAVALAINLAFLGLVAVVVRWSRFAAKGS